MEWINDPTIWASLLTLTLQEIVLGIDNVIFVSIVANRLPEARRATPRRIGLGGALGLRLVFLSMIAWIIGLTEPPCTILDQTVSWRDMILITGGLFLIYKGTSEIHDAVGMAERPWVMITAVILAMGVMLSAAGPISRFIGAHPTAKMLALSFLLLVGLALIADGLHFHIPRGYLYFAVAFSVVVEALNLLAKRKRKVPV